MTQPTDEIKLYAWPPVKGIRSKATQVLLKMSFWLRHHPARFLFSDALMGAADKSVEGEARLLNRDWQGSIWDVGASVGKYTTILARANPKHRVYAFEPNLNSLYYLGYRTAKLPNVVIVPCALTSDGSPFKTSYSPDFFLPPTGPCSLSLSLGEAIAKFGTPSFAKFDIEGGEYFLFDREPEVFRNTALLIEWHKYKVCRPIPAMSSWKSSDAVPEDTLLATRFYEPLSRLPTGISAGTVASRNAEAREGNQK
jgi:FkbM family methyltransferase